MLPVPNQRDEERTLSKHKVTNQSQWQLNVKEDSHWHILAFAFLAVFGFELFHYPKAQIAGATYQTAPYFTLQDAQGQPFTLVSQRGHRVVLYFYRGYRSPFCMKQLREFAQRKSDFDAQNARVVGISVDDPEHARKVWDDVAHQNATILSDPDAKVIRE